MSGSVEAGVSTVLVGGGEVGALMRAADWEDSSLGPVAVWPQALRNAVMLCLGSLSPIGIYWGEQLTLVHNDAFRALIGAKHPEALGRSAAEVMPEIWDLVGPMLGDVLATGVATEFRDALLPLTEGGHAEDRWFDFTANPIRDEEGAIVGVFTIAVETSSRVLAQRKIAEAEAERRLSRGAAAAGLSTDFQVLFEASPTPFLVVAPPDWTIVAANDARLKITGTRREDQIGRPLFEVFPDDPEDPAADGVRNLTASLDRVMATKASDTMAVQRYAVRDPDGRFAERWWSPVNAPVLAANGEVALVIHRVEEVTDIVHLRGEAEAQHQLIRDQHAVIDRLRETESALRRSEQHLRLMVNELNHRVKNTLAIVQSIVAQTLSGDKSDEAGDVIAARLVALAKAHDMLTDEHWDGADLHDIVRATAEPYASEGLPRVQIAGPVLKTPPELALTLALILHELATNAVKYGALSAPDGRVEITWDVVPDPVESVLKLVWREAGGPVVSVPERRGFGTRLIGRSLAAHGGGRAELIFDPAGVECRLTARVG